MERLLQGFYSIKSAIKERASFELPSVKSIIEKRSYTKIFDLENYRDTFSPSRIFAQIIILQCFYYVTATIMFCFLASLAGYPFSFDWIFSWEPITFGNALGLTLTVLWLVDSLLCIGFMTIIVGRSKLAWDFALTIHAINFIVCWTYSGKFPKSLLWWALQIVSSVILVSLGTYTSRWKELRDTFFDGLNDAELGQNSSETVAEGVSPNSIPLERLAN